MTIQIKATERHFPVMMFVTVFNLVIRSNRESEDEILRCDLSNKSYSAVLSNGAICFSAFYKMEVGNFVEFYSFPFVGVKGLKGYDENVSLM